MSIENHPNFHAVNFVTKIIEAYYESLRGKATKWNAPAPTALLANFALDVEEMVDKCGEKTILKIK